MRGAFETTIKPAHCPFPLEISSTPNLDTPVVRPSPSSPADLSNMGMRMTLPKPAERPATHFYPEREPRSRGMSIVSAKSTATTPKPRIVDNLDEFWPPTPDSGLRPFSFAVRAGAGATGGSGSSVNGSDGHGRRTMFGRFGGSVTSLFAGSNHGSGSMMDMQ